MIRDTSDNHIDEKLLTKVILLAGRILLECSAETIRIEDTMNRIARSLGYQHSNGYVVNIFITFSLSQNSEVQIIRIHKNNTNLIKIANVNTISRKLVNKEITLEEAYKKLKDIDLNTKNYPLLLKALVSGLISLSFLYLFGGQFGDIIPAFIAGSVGFSIVEMIKMRIPTLFIPELIGSFVIGVIAIWGHHLMSSGDISPIIISCVMPIVPGVLITTAVQDLFDRHMVMFTTKMLEAIVTSFGIGSGIATSFLIL